MESQPLIKPKIITVNKILLIVGILFVSFNLRPAITSVGPLIGYIRTDLTISNGIAGLITTIPLLSFAFFSLVAPKLGYRYSNEWMVFAGLCTLITGMIIRSTGFISFLFIGTALVGIGIAISNVLLPSIVKNRFPENIGLLTAIYTTSMSGFAALGSGLTIPIANIFHLNWQQTLLIWSVLAVAAVLFWIPQLHYRSQNKSFKIEPTHAESNSSIWKSKIAWQVTIFMGFQSFLFYCMIAWLPEILSGGNVSITVAGWMLSIMQIAGLPMAFFTPIFADRLRNQQGIVLMIGTLYVTGLMILLTTNNVIFTLFAIILIGLGQGSAISLALTLLGLRAANASQAAQLSGMAQSVGYSFAAIGPFLIGYLLDITNSVAIPLFIFLFIVIVMVIVGMGAGRSRTIFQKEL
ncbi:MFS transporter [Evansella sp. AB-P1]|uniref:CynX/NimT family MFS transporter n=1 Tax=Evansella sp. AB-P1 TaxID=3037653 RepID=UPI00241F7DC8|nr:MFS transporter [Evansella sp. AB-P1]MDG5788423.1 MFS transporter [Evansella sp. AB-P1]